MRRLLEILLLLAIGLCIPLALLALVELPLIAWLRDPEAAEGTRAALLQNHYFEHERRIIQFIPECARWDPEVTYTLRPGECRFANREFDTLVSVNRLGVRDDAASLDGPRVVVVGDSHAMGWGVQQEESFPQRLEALIGVPVLNTGISSYGTARELRLLERVDRRRLETLVVQYSFNDVVENRAWVESGGDLPITSEERYLEVARAHMADAREYRFGLYALEWVKLLFNRLTHGGSKTYGSGPGASSLVAEAVDAFLQVLDGAKVDLAGVELVVLDVESRAENDARFIDELRRRVDADGLPAGLRGLRTVDITGVLDADDYYRWDDHMRASGHDAVARRIAAALTP